MIGCGVPLALPLAPKKHSLRIRGSVSIPFGVYTESISSLKTEENTERQCGQHGGFLPLELSVNSGMETIHPNKTKKTIKLGTGVSGLFPPDTTDFPERSHFGDKFLMESLILAQDERWRRA